MGKKSSEVLQISYEDLVEYLHSNHSVYMQVGHQVYYLTDVNFEAWRAQDTSIRNSKNHFVDCSELVPTVDEFLALPFINGKSYLFISLARCIVASAKSLLCDTTTKPNILPPIDFHKLLLSLDMMT